MSRSVLSDVANKVILMSRSATMFSDTKFIEGKTIAVENGHSHE